MARIFVVGSINMDLVARLAHAPKIGETILANDFFVAHGGKGANQACAVAKLGGSVSMIGRVGSDEYGKSLIDNMSSQGVDVAFVGVADCASGLALISVVDGDNTIVVAQGANATLSTTDIDRGLSVAVKGDILIAQLEVPLNIVQYALSKARDKGIFTILNPAPAQQDISALLPYVDMVVPNETETEILTGINPSDEVNLTLAVKGLYKSGARAAVITLGAQGSAVAEGQTITYIDPIKTKVVDTTAAGDTYIGAMATRLASKDDILSACRYAAVASSITVGSKGAIQSIPTKDIVDKRLKELLSGR